MLFNGYYCLLLRFNIDVGFVVIYIYIYIVLDVVLLYFMGCFKLCHCFGFVVFIVL